MCVIFFAFQEHPHYPLILLANRDEFYDRPTAAASNWTDHPDILAGRDLVHGGTWLGVTREGRFGAVTNYRQPDSPKGTVSRGDLVSGFLKGNMSPHDYLQNIHMKRDRFSGFNLLVGEVNSNDQNISYYSNRQGEIVDVSRGIHGLSNHLLNTPWPKVVSGKEKMLSALHKKKVSDDEMFQVLADRSIASDSELPETGVGIERERILSPIFIETPIYGTRSSTLLLIDKNGKIDLKERVFH